MADLEQFFGKVVDVLRRTDGDELTAAAGIAETVLHVGDTADFDETGGVVQIGAETYTYDELDHDANTITLTSGLLEAAAEGDRVDVIDEELNQVVVEYVAHVLMEDQDRGDEPIEVTVQHSLVNLLAESVRGGVTESVTLLRDGDDDLVIWQVDGKIVEDIALETRLDPIDSTLVQLNEDLDELNTVTLPGVQADLAAIEGLFPIGSTSISDSAITTPKLAANSVVASKIVALTITGDKLAANSVSADKIVANSIGTDKLAANAVTADKIQANAIDGKTLNGIQLTTNGGAWTLDGVGLYNSTLTTWVQNNGTIGCIRLSASGEAHAAVGFHDDGLVGGGLTNANIGNGGRIVRDTSSLRYKTDVVTAAVDTDAVLSLTPKTFRRIDDDSGAEYLGLIAEEVEAAGLDHLVFHNAEEQVEGVHYASALVTALLAVCKTQQSQIDDLTARVETLEAL